MCAYIISSPRHPTHPSLAPQILLPRPLTSLHTRHLLLPLRAPMVTPPPPSRLCPRGPLKETFPGQRLGNCKLHTHLSLSPFSALFIFLSSPLDHNSIKATIWWVLLLLYPKCLAESLAHNRH